MTRLLRRASLLVALSLLISAATAYAECAWVLWEHSYEVWVDSNKDNHRRDGYWKKVTATRSCAPQVRIFRDARLFGPPARDG